MSNGHVEPQASLKQSAQSKKRLVRGLLSILTGITIALASSVTFLLFVSRHDFGPMLSPRISDKGFLNIYLFLTNQSIAIVAALATLSAAFTLTIALSSYTRLGGFAEKAILVLTSVSATALISWTGTELHEFENGRLFRSATDDYAEPIRMLVLSASFAVLSTFLVVLLLLAARALCDFSTSLTEKRAESRRSRLNQNDTGRQRVPDKEIQDD